MFDIISFAELARSRADVYTVYPWDETCSVTWMPESMSVTIVFAVPFGPNPAEMKRGTTVGGVLLPPVQDDGFGEYTVDSKLFL